MNTLLQESRLNRCGYIDKQSNILFRPYRTLQTEQCLSSASLKTMSIETIFTSAGVLTPLSVRRPGAAPGRCP